MSSPIVDFQVIRWRIPHPLAVVLAAIAAVLMIASMFFLVIWSATKIVATAGDQATQVKEILDSVKATELFKPLFEELPTGEYEIRFEELAQLLPGYASQILGKSVSLMSSTFFVLIFVMFLLAGRDPHAVRQGIYAEIEKKIRNYITTKLFVSAGTGIFVWFSLRLLHLELAEVFGLLAFILNFIPSIGSVISTLLPVSISRYSISYNE